MTFLHTQRICTSNVTLVKRQSQAPDIFDPSATRNQGNLANVDGKAFLESEFCKKSGIKASDGSQNRAGFCVSTPMGSVPSEDKMISTIILKPKNGETVSGKDGIEVTVRTMNIEFTFFDNSTTQYYVSPQTLNSKGFVQGHQHIVFQQISDDSNGGNPPDPQLKNLKFFNAFDEKPAANGMDVNLKTAPIDPGLYRVCTMTASASHQPVIMPVAKRGPQDDCIRVTVN